MKRILRLAMLIAFLVIIVVTCSAQTVSESIGDRSSIDWTNQTIQATGIGITGGAGGRPGQIRAAELDALRQILETIKGMRLNSETTVENFMMSSDIIRTRVEGTVKNFRRVGDPVYLSNGDIEVTVEMDLRGTGKFYDIVMPGPASIPPTPISPRSGTAISNTKIYTGLIVDARGLGLRPAIAPNIYSSSGDEVYGSRYVDRQWAIEQGMVSYAKDPDKARGDERVTPSPLFVKAQKATGANRTDVVITDQDALTLHQVADNLKFLQECRVIILVD